MGRVEGVCLGFRAHFRVAFRCYSELSFSLLVRHDAERIVGLSVRITGVNFPRLDLL